MFTIPRFFSPHELLHSNTAVQQRIRNIPSWQVLQNLIQTGLYMDRVRELLGAPITVTSGFRSVDLNKAVRGSSTSSHMQGEAIDFRCNGLTTKQICDRIAASDIRYDQILDENTWVHIGFKLPMRMQYLRRTPNGYVPGR